MVWVEVNNGYTMGDFNSGKIESVRIAVDHAGDFSLKR